MDNADLGQKYNDKGWDLQNGLTSGTPDPDAAIEWYEKAVKYTVYVMKRSPLCPKAQY